MKQLRNKLLKSATIVFINKSMVKFKILKYKSESFFEKPKLELQLIKITII